MSSLHIHVVADEIPLPTGGAANNNNAITQSLSTSAVAEQVRQHLVHKVAGLPAGTSVSCSALTPSAQSNEAPQQEEKKKPAPKPKGKKGKKKAEEEEEDGANSEEDDAPKPADGGVKSELPSFSEVEPLCRASRAAPGMDIVLCLSQNSFDLVKEYFELTSSGGDAGAAAEEKPTKGKKKAVSSTTEESSGSRRPGTTGCVSASSGRKEAILLLHVNTTTASSRATAGGGHQPQATAEGRVCGANAHVLKALLAGYGSRRSGEGGELDDMPSVASSSSSGASAASLLSQVDSQVSSVEQLKGVSVLHHLHWSS